jgi:hypothetical protein
VQKTAAEALLRARKSRHFVQSRVRAFPRLIRCGGMQISLIPRRAKRRGIKEKLIMWELCQG